MEHGQAEREIRADFDRDSIVVYQAFNPAIAKAAVAAGRFRPPFSLNRMTWVKPSFLWMMERSNWGRSPGQECILAIRISRAGWESALAQAALTSPEPEVYPDATAWSAQLAASAVRVQWDPERNLRGGKLPHRSIQVGLSRHIVSDYVEDWTQSITDLSPLVARLRELRAEGRLDHLRRLLPPERPYPLPEPLRRRLGMA
jgi:hypothetical protein